MAEFAPLINGISYSGASVRVTISGVALPGLKAIDFKKKSNKKNVMGSGRNVNSRSYTGFEYEGKLTLLQNDLTALENASPNFDPTQLPPFDLIVSYMEGNIVKSYTLVAIDFTEWGNSTKTDDDESVSDLPFIFADLKRTR
jgi:hypothetical protein